MKICVATALFVSCFSGTYAASSCQKDTCYNALVNQQRGAPALSSRKADCSSALMRVIDDKNTKVILYSTTVNRGTTITFTTTQTATTLQRRYAARPVITDSPEYSDWSLLPRDQIVVTGNRPYYMSAACKDIQAYATACLCFGIKAATEYTLKTRQSTQTKTVVATATVILTVDTTLTSTTDPSCTTQTVLVRITETATEISSTIDTSTFITQSPDSLETVTRYQTSTYTPSQTQTDTITESSTSFSTPITTSTGTITQTSLDSTTTSTTISPITTTTTTTTYIYQSPFPRRRELMDFEKLLYDQRDMLPSATIQAARRGIPSACPPGYTQYVTVLQTITTTLSSQSLTTSTLPQNTITSEIIENVTQTLPTQTLTTLTTITTTVISTLATVVGGETTTTTQILSFTITQTISQDPRPTTTATVTSTSLTTCPTGAFQVTCDVGCTLFNIDLTTGARKTIKANLFGSDADATIGAIGYNSLDKMLWGLRTDTRQLLRMTQQGQITTFSVPDVTIRRFSGADVDENGMYWGFEQGKYYIQIDLKTNPPRIVAQGSIQQVPFSRIDDVAYIPGGVGYLYGVSNVSGLSAYLFRFDRSSKTWTRINPAPETGYGPLGQDTDSTYGAIYATPQGGLYVTDNFSGKTWKISLDGKTAVQLAQTFEGVNFLDGASCVV